MFPTASLLSTLFLVFTVAASPIVMRDSLITLPIVKRLSLNGTNIAKHDQDRIRALLGHASEAQNIQFSGRDIVNEPLTNTLVSYVASVDVGSPATTYTLLVDTGSSNTWLGADKKYIKTSTSKQTSNKVSVSYGSGSMSGTEFTDQVSLGSGLTIPSQSIGVASTTKGFDGVDGILGIGPVDLTVGTLSPGQSSSIPTVTDNLFRQGTIPSNMVSISFEPPSSAQDANGELTWGGTDSSKFTGEITYTPITTKSPANQFWGINQSIKYGTSTNILSSTAGIVDSGTTLVLIASDAFQRYQRATGGFLDDTTGLLKVTPDQFAKLQSLFFTIGGTPFELTANAQIWPRSLNSEIGGTADSIYLIVADVGSPSGQGLDFINGQAFHERFYTVYDTANKRVGFATTPFTTATTN